MQNKLLLLLTQTFGHQKIDMVFLSQFWSGFTDDSESMQSSVEEVQGRTFIPIAKISSQFPQRRDGNQKFQNTILQRMTQQQQTVGKARPLPQCTRGVYSWSQG